MLYIITLLFALTFAKSDLFQLVKTPHGLRPAKCVHHAPSGSILTPKDGYTEMYHPPTGERRIVPQDQDCVDNANELFLRKPGQVGPTRLQTWVDYAYFALSHDDNMGNFTSVYNVPSESPPAKGQLLYFFNGMQNDATPPITIVQPVVNYCGNTPDCATFNFSNLWSMEPWNCCPSGQTWYGDNIPVTTSDSINAWIYAGAVDKSVTIGMALSNNGKPTTLTVQDMTRVWDWAAATIEEYSATLCTYYNSKPFNTTKMLLTDLAGNKVTPTWTKVDNAKCSGGPVVIDDADISLYGANMPSE